MSFPRYPKYKASGVEWLGDVPEHWAIDRIANLFREVTEPGTDDLPILSVSIHHGVSDKEIDEDDMDRKVARSDDRSKYKQVQPGDLVYNMMRAWQGGFGTVTVRGMVSPAYVVARPKKPLETAYIEHLLRTPQAIEQMRRHSRGVTDFRLRLYWDEFSNLRFPLPPGDEQKDIADFLDHETANIDAMVAEQEKLISLLKEKCQAVISQAVTKGLYPNAPMKDSGIEWLGDVPAHWVIAPVKNFFQSLDGRRKPLSSEERGVMLGEYPYYGASGVIDSVNDFLFDESLVLVSEDGANLLNRSTPISFVATGKYWVNNHAHILRPLDQNFSFWSERIEAIDLTPVVTGSAQPKLTIEALLNLKIATPSSAEERAEIQRYIEKQAKETDSLLNEARCAISLLQERRSAIISAAVTGQIDVRAKSGMQTA